MDARKIAVVMSLGLAAACQTTRGERTASASQEAQQEMTAAPELREGEEAFDGRVTSVYGDTVFVTSELGRDELLQVVPQTVITVDGRRARLSDIQEGQEIRATFTVEGGRNVAVRIEAERAGER